MYVARRREQPTRLWLTRGSPPVAIWAPASELWLGVWKIKRAVPAPAAPLINTLNDGMTHVKRSRAQAGPAAAATGSGPPMGWPPTDSRCPCSANSPPAYGRLAPARRSRAGGQPTCQPTRGWLDACVDPYSPHVPVGPSCKAYAIRAPAALHAHITGLWLTRAPVNPVHTHSHSILAADSPSCTPCRQARCSGRPAQ